MKAKRKKPMVRGHFINRLNRLFPEIRARESEEFCGMKRGIWLGGSESYHSDGERFFNYWAMSPEGYIHKDLRKECADALWYEEPHDAGTLFLWPYPD